MKKIGVVLSGCGKNDGAEVHESVLTLLYLDEAGVETVCMAPVQEQMDVVDHQTGRTLAEKRNVFVESARISRGNLKNIADMKAADLDGLILPGGFGAAKNLSTFATQGQNCEVIPELKKLILDLHSQAKPIGFICIAPAVAAKAFGSSGINVALTIGTDKETAQALEKMGVTHQECAVDDIVIDDAHRVISTPAYMLASSIKEAACGIRKLVRAVVERA